jgi:putative transcriptional regulator
MAIHTMPLCAEEEIVPGVYFATQRDNLYRLVGQQQYEFRIFSGYSGWAGGQLENELQVGGWLTRRATEDYIFRQKPDELWKHVAGDIGGDVLQSVLKVKNQPENPSHN